MTNSLDREHTQRLYGNTFDEISKDELLMVTLFGDPIFQGDNSYDIYQIYMEDGSREDVGDIKYLTYDDYYIQSNVRTEWEAKHGTIPAGHFLVGIIPFCLGGPFEISNMKMLPADKAVEHYKLVRAEVESVVLAAAKDREDAKQSAA